MPKLKIVGNVGINTNQDKSSVADPAGILGGIIYGHSEWIELAAGAKLGVERARGRCHGDSRDNAPLLDFRDAGIPAKRRAKMLLYAVDGFKESLLPLLVINSLPVAITVIDPRGYILAFNSYSQEILNRKPEFLGMDIRSCHAKDESIHKIDAMLESFERGRRESFHYEGVRYGRHMFITIAPVEQDGRLIACVQTVIPDPGEKP